MSKTHRSFSWDRKPQQRQHVRAADSALDQLEEYGFQPTTRQRKQSRVKQLRGEA